MILQDEREIIVAYGKKMIESGLVKATGGNLSLCNQEKALVAITPTGVAYDEMKPESVVVLDLKGNHVDGDLKPSSEVSFHLGLINLREDILAVVHTHSPSATTMACLGRALPAIHYLIGYAGTCVPVAPYATYGTEELSENICYTIGSGNAVLMANHGLVTVAGTMEKAFLTAEMVEFVAGIYLRAKPVGEPVVLSEESMREVLSKFDTYGQQ